MFPSSQRRKAIRAFKVYDEHGAWSQCLVCAGYWEVFLTDDNRIDYRYIGEVGNREKGWFCTRQ